MKIEVIIPAAGKGKRLKSSISKPFINIGSRPLISYVLKTFSKLPEINSIIIACDKNAIKKIQNITKKYKLKKIKKIVVGGASRAQSVKNALRHIDEDTDYVVVHDAARPCVKNMIIKKAIKRAIQRKASCVCVPSIDTVKLAKDNRIIKTIDRKNVWFAQTPQVFKKNIILKAYSQNFKNATDSSSLVEKMGQKVSIVKGDCSNIKVTTLSDLAVVQKYFYSKRKDF